MFTIYNYLILTRHAHAMFTTHSRLLFTNVAQSIMSKNIGEPKIWSASTWL